MSTPTCEPSITSHLPTSSIALTNTKDASSIATGAPNHSPPESLLPSVRALIACVQSMDECLKAYPLEVFQHVTSTPGGRAVQLVASVTPFHSSAPPPVSLPAYALRIIHHSGYGAAGLAVGIALMGRYAKTIGAAPSPLTAHRLLATCIVVGMKASCDKFVKNVYMAPIVGVPLHELNHLEVTLLRSLAFSAIPDADEMFGIIASLAKLTEASDRSSCALHCALTGSAKKVTLFGRSP